MMRRSRTIACPNICGNIEPDSNRTMNDLAMHPSIQNLASGDDITRRLAVLYGTETGNCLEIARALVQAAGRFGMDVPLHDMSDYDPRNLGDEEDVLIIVSTFGEGDPPQPATNFFKFLEGEAAPRLDMLRYSVLALGDSAYEFFCGAGRRLDERFEELGAIRLLPRVDCDIDYEEPSAEWSEAVLEQLREGRVPAQDVADVEEYTAAPICPGLDKRHPLPATILRNIPLVKEGSSKDTRHIELSVADSGLTYEPGDALGMIASNDRAVVEALIAALGFSGDAMVEVNGQPMPLVAALERHLEITTATPRFLTYWAGRSDAAPLGDMLAEGCSSARADFLHAHHIVDIIRKYPARQKVDVADFVAALRPLQPRLYSISSSVAATPGEVHLTVAPVSYSLHGQMRRGVATGQLAHRCPPGTELSVYIHANEHFRLPADDVPIIMIGAGTGIAPYRGFLQERRARGASGRNYLFFGERSRRTDFLYEAEWVDFLIDGVLTHMETAFSRDGEKKVYVQHRMLEKATEIYDWLQEGAHVYVCGDAQHLAPDVHEALIQIVALKQNAGREAAVAYIDALLDEHRYHRDVY